VLSFATARFVSLIGRIGREDSDFEDQLRAYAWLAMHWRETEGRTLAIVVRLREMTVDTYLLDRRELDEWHVASSATRRTWSGSGRGGTVRGANGELSVSAARVVIAASAAALRILPSNPGPRRPRSVDDDTLVALHDRIRNVEGACETAREQLRGHG
jgi:hypothetical protein